MEINEKVKRRMEYWNKGLIRLYSKDDDVKFKETNIKCPSCGKKKTILKTLRNKKGETIAEDYVCKSCGTVFGKKMLQNKEEKK